MGFTLEDQTVPMTKAANCLLALTHAESPDPGPALACIRCGRCADACPANLLPQQLYWHTRAKDLDRVQDYNLFDCIECGCCAHVCPSHIPLVQYYRYAKTESWAREQDKKKADHAKARHAAKLERQERLERERQAKLRARKKPAPAAAAKGDAAATAEDPKKAAIEAARQRAAAKKAALAEQGATPKNTEDLPRPRNARWPPPRPVGRRPTRQSPQRRRWRPRGPNRPPHHPLMHVRGRFFLRFLQNRY